jgi:hypothetical protein
MIAMIAILRVTLSAKNYTAKKRKKTAKKSARKKIGIANFLNLDYIYVYT